MLHLNLMSIHVNNPKEAMVFYTVKLGFEKRTIHESMNYMTVGMPGSEVELILEPNENIIAKAYQEGLYKQGIPAASFGTDNLKQEYNRLNALGIKFTMPPKEAFGTWLAIFDDEQGNLIQIVETKGN